MDNIHLKYQMLDNINKQLLELHNFKETVGPEYLRLDIIESKIEELEKRRESILKIGNNDIFDDFKKLVIYFDEHNKHVHLEKSMVTELIDYVENLKSENRKLRCCENCVDYKPYVTVDESIGNMCEDFWNGCNNNVFEPYCKWRSKYV